MLRNGLSVLAGLILALVLAGSASAVNYTEVTLPAWGPGSGSSKYDLGPNGAVFGDFDEDGVTDMVVIDYFGYTADTNDPTVVFYRGDHLGFMTPMWGFNLLSPDAPHHSLPYPQVLAKADLNKDGHLDLVIGSRGIDGSGMPFGPFVLYGNGDGSFQQAVSLPVPGGSSASVNALEIRDVNKDGWVDIVATVGYFSGTSEGVDLVIWPNLLGIFGPHIDYTYDSDARWWNGRTLVVGEFGGDGNVDIVVADPASGLRFFKGNGNGTFDDPVVKITATQIQAMQHSPSQPEGYGATIKDLDKDGCNDYILGLYDEVVWFRGHCNDTFSAPVRIGLVSGVNTDYTVVDKPIVADFNHDNRNDVAYRGRIFARQANGSYVVAPPDVGAGIKFFASTDLNHDGVPDLVGMATGANNDGDHLSLYHSTSGPASQVQLIGDGQSTTVNTPFANAVGVRVRDASNNAVSGVEVTFSYIPANANIPGGHGFTDASGSFTTTATAGSQGGCYTVTAAFAGAGAGLADAEFNLCNTWPNLIQTISGSPQTQQVNQTFANPLVARVLDGNGDPLPGATVTFSTSSSSGARTWLSANSGGPWSLSLSQTSEVSGYVMAYAQANGVAGTYHVTVSSPNATAGPGFQLTNTPVPGAPAKVVITSPNPVSAMIGQQYNSPIIAQLQDAAGTPIPNGGTLVFAQPNDPNVTTGALLSAGATPCTTGVAGPVAIAVDAGGNATLNGCANGWPGVTAVSVGLQGNASVTPASAGAYNFVENPDTLVSSSGTPQSAPVTTAFGQVLRVTVLDSHGAPVPSATVRFAAPTTGASASLSSGIAHTDLSGEAWVVATANGTSGSYVVTASVQADRVTTLTTNFDLTNTAAVPVLDPVGIPTLSDWGVVLLGLLLAAVGARRSFRQPTVLD